MTKTFVIVHIFRLSLGLGMAALFLWAYLHFQLNDTLFKSALLIASIASFVWTLSLKLAIVVKFNQSKCSFTKRVYFPFRALAPDKFVYSYTGIESLILRRTIRTIPGGFEQQFSISIKQENSESEILIFEATELPLFARDFAYRMARKLNTKCQEQTLRFSRHRTHLILQNILHLFTDQNRIPVTH